MVLEPQVIWKRVKVRRWAEKRIVTNNKMVSNKFRQCLEWWNSAIIKRWEMDGIQFLFVLLLITFLKIRFWEIHTECYAFNFVDFINFIFFAVDFYWFLLLFSEPKIIAIKIVITSDYWFYGIIFEVNFLFIYFLSVLWGWTGTNFQQSCVQRIRTKPIGVILPEL